MNERRARSLLSSCASVVAPLSILLLSSLADAQPPAQASGEKSREPEMASRGQREAVRKIRYGDWEKVCFKTPASGTVCRTAVSGTFDTGQSAVRVNLIERDGESKARLQLFLPVGLYLPAGVKLTVDQGKTYQVPYAWCMTNTCIAGGTADPQLIRDMEKGEKLTLEVVDSSVQSVSTEVPLHRFAAIHEGAPAKTFLQDIDE